MCSLKGVAVDDAAPPRMALPTRLHFVLVEVYCDTSQHAVVVEVPKSSLQGRRITGPQPVVN